MSGFSQSLREMFIIIHNLQIINIKYLNSFKIKNEVSFNPKLYFHYL